MHKKIDNIAFYRWEFLRRNANYRKDCDKYIKSRRNPKILKTILTKFLYPPCDYNKKYSELFQSNSRKKKKQNPEKALKTFLQEYSKSDYGSRDILVKEDSYSHKPLTSKNYKHLAFKTMPAYNQNISDIKKIQTLKISLNLYYSKEKIFQVLGPIIDRYRCYIKLAHGAKLTLSETFEMGYDSVTRKLNLNKISNDKHYLDTVSRARFGEYKNYLKVYDWIMAGKSSAETAKRFYRGDFDRDKYYAVKKVNRDYDRCKKLIEGGYGQIR